VDRSLDNVLLGLSGRQSERNNSRSLNRLLGLLELLKELLLCLQLSLHCLNGQIHRKLYP
jgi:hypothetical protein